MLHEKVKKLSLCYLIVLRYAQGSLACLAKWGDLKRFPEYLMERMGEGVGAKAKKFIALINRFT